MTQFNAPAYDIQRPTGLCAFTGRKLQPGEPYVAALVETDPNSDDPRLALGFRRLDISMEAWSAGNRPEKIYGFWRSIVPQLNQKRKLFVDDEVLMNLFKRLADAQQEQRLAFRFVLALLLMRKKLLRYEGCRYETLPAAGEQPARENEYWKMIPKGEEQPLEVLNPQLDEQRIVQVTEQLGEILEAEL